MELEHSSFSDLMAQVRAGSEAAARIIVTRYQPYVLRVVRRNLAREIRAKFDSADFAQAVWTSFFAHREEFLAVSDPDGLIALLAVMARNKIVDELRRRLASKKHNVRRETSLGELGNLATGAHSASLETPSKVAMAREVFQQLTEGQSARDRRILELRMAGETVDRIARELRISERTVRRALTRMQRRVMNDA
jgi:RNA polymerase sigma-70 factor (ECF subfamily)